MANIDSENGNESAAIHALLQIPRTTETTLKHWLSTATIVERGCKEAENIVNYLHCGQEHGYGFVIQDLIRITRKEDKKFNPQNKQGQMRRMMLWHGTHKNSLAGILQDGFIIPEHKGQMFGPGIYFADRASKSANYTDDKRPGCIGYMLLCDVAVGNIYNAKSPNHGLTSPPSYNGRPCDSVMGMGKSIPDNLGSIAFNGSEMPLGPTKVRNDVESCPLLFNEYIIYNTKNIKIDYVIRFMYTFHPSPAFIIY